MILTHTRPSIFIPVITFAWGAMAALIGIVQNYQQLLALRFLLGVFEAGFSVSLACLSKNIFCHTDIPPSQQSSFSSRHGIERASSTSLINNSRTSLLLTHTRSKRFIVFLSAGILSGAFGSVVAGAITSTLDGAHGIPGWRWLFIVEGAGTSGISLIVHWTLLDYPHRSRGLSPEEVNLATQRLIQDGIADHGANQETQNASTILASFLEAVCSWRTWLLIPGYMTILGALAISYFYPTLVEGLGYSSTNAQYMTAPLYMVSLVVAIPVCIVADRKPHLRGIFLVVNLMAGAVFFALTAALQNFTVRYVLLCFINITIWTGNALALSFATTSLAAVDRNARAIMLAMMNGLAALAQLYGSALFPKEDAPGYIVGFSVFSGTFVVGAMLYGAAYMLFRRYPYVSSG